MTAADDALRKLRAKEKRAVSRRRVAMREALFDAEQAANVHRIAQDHPHPLQGKRPLPIRTSGLGMLLGAFYLPLSLATPRNRSRGKQAAWVWSEQRRKVLSALEYQMVAKWNRALIGAKRPLIGRPMIRCIRYSAGETDSIAGWGKMPVDCMQPGGMRRGRPFSGLGIIASDSPKHTDVVEWCEPSRMLVGFAVFEIWSGI